mgnify:CR=1 FL=1
MKVIGVFVVVVVLGLNTLADGQAPRIEEFKEEEDGG